jgi:hypothetical protein
MPRREKRLTKKDPAQVVPTTDHSISTEHRDMPLKTLSSPGR